MKVYYSLTARGQIVAFIDILKEYREVSFRRIWRLFADFLLPTYHESIKSFTWTTFLIFL